LNPDKTNKSSTRGSKAQAGHNVTDDLNASCLESHIWGLKATVLFAFLFQTAIGLPHDSICNLRVAGLNHDKTIY
jgi:hypothetical protein